MGSSISSVETPTARAGLSIREVLSFFPEGKATGRNLFMVSPKDVS
jgi:hypothetical protein